MGDRRGAGWLEERMRRGGRRAYRRGAQMSRAVKATDGGGVTVASRSVVGCEGAAPRAASGRVTTARGSVTGQPPPQPSPAKNNHQPPSADETQPAMPKIPGFARRHFVRDGTDRTFFRTNIIQRQADRGERGKRELPGGRICAPVAAVAGPGGGGRQMAGRG